MAVEELVIRILGSADEFAKELDRVGQKTKALENGLKTVARNSAIAFAALTAAIAGTVKAFADFETALVGVAKTTNLSGKELENFADEITRLSSEIPVSANELLKISQIAGQLGVTGTDNLVKFTDTIAKLGVASDLSGEEAATALARILNVSGESIDQVDKLASVIVALGNNFATTESEIANAATQVAASTAVFGVTSAQAAGLATALRSVGVRAELSGSAVGRAFRAIDKSVREGGKSLDDLAKLTGVTGDEFKRVFEKDAVAGFQLFIEGLGDVAAAGGDTTAELAKFGLRGEELLKVLPTLAKNSKLVGDALGLAAKEAGNATALNEEASRAFDTLNSRVQIAQNNLTAAAVALGERFAPAIESLVEGVGLAAKRFSELDDETLDSIANLVKAGAAVAGIVAGLATLGLGIVKVVKFLRTFKKILDGSRIAAGLFFGSFTFGIGTILSFLPEIISGVSALLNLFDDFSEPAGNVEGLNRELKKLEEDRQKAIEDLAQAQEDQAVDEQRILKARLEGLDKEIDKRNELLNNAEEFAKLTEDEQAGVLGLPGGAAPVSRPDSEFQNILGRQENLQSTTAADEKKFLEEQERQQAAQKKINAAKTQADKEAAAKAAEQLKKDAAFRAQERTKEIQAISAGGLAGAFGALTGPEGDVRDADGNLVAVQSSLTAAEKAVGLTSNALTSLGQGANGAKQAFLDTARIVGETLLPGFGDAIAQGAEILSRSPEELRAQLIAFFKEIPTILTNVFENAFKTVVQTVISQLGELIDGIFEAVTFAVQTLFEAIPELVEILIEEIPEIVNAIIEGVPDIINAIVEGIPVVIRRLAQLAPQLIIALIAELPKFTAALIAEAPALALALAIVLSKAMPFVAVTFAQELIKQAPNIARAIIDAITSAPKAAGGAVGGLGGQIGGVFGGLFKRGGFVKAQGGGIPGLAGSADRIPALLEPGELVVPRQVVPDFQQAIGNQAVANAASGGGESGETVIRVEGAIDNDTFMNDLMDKIAEKRRFENADIGDDA